MSNSRDLERIERQRRARIQAEQVALDALKAMRKMATSLEQTVAERTAEIQASNAAFERAGRLRENFLAHLTHELRTPINGISGMLELLGQELAGSPQQAWVDAALTETLRLDTLISRIVYFAELQSAAAWSDETPKAVSDALDEVMARWMRRLAPAGQLLVVSSELSAEMVLPSPGAVHRVLDELLDNVRRHSSPGVVRLRVGDHPGGVCFELTDNGPAVTDGVVIDVGQLFDSGEDPALRVRSGAAIGLATVARLVELLGGSAELRRNATGTNTARVTVPATTPGQAGVSIL